MCRPRNLILAMAISKKSNVWMAFLALTSLDSEARATTVEYRIAGIIQKDAISDRLFESSTDEVRFEIHLVADVREATEVPAGVEISLPSFPNVALRESGILLSRSALRSLSFRLSSGKASFGLADVIANPVTRGSVFLTGAPTRPTGIKIPDMSLCRLNWP
jgi:hypothetical protein